MVITQEAYQKAVNEINNIVNDHKTIFDNKDKQITKLFVKNLEIIIEYNGQSDK